MAESTQVTAPSDEPVTIQEVKDHLKIEHDDEDGILLTMIKAARNKYENETGRQLVTATWDLYLDEFDDEIEIPYPPLASVTSVKYYDTDGVEQTASSSIYEVDIKTEPGIIRRKNWDSQSWPTHQGSRKNVITIRFVAGYGDPPDVPSIAKMAIMMLVGHWYENREDSVVGNYFRTTPKGYDSLVKSLKVYTLS